MNGNQAWISMFRRIPANLHDTLSLGLTTGSEIVVQKIVKLEPDFMIIRGRLAGTQDSGRIVLIPYAQMTFLALTRPMKDSDVEVIFGKGEPPAIANLPMLPAGDDNAPLAEHPEEPTPDSDTAPEAAPAKKPEISKTALLAKLRSQLRDGK